MHKEIAGFDVEIIRKKIKNMYLSVLPDGKVRISAPSRVPTSLIEQFIISRYEWIKRQQNKILERPVKPIHEYKNGEICYLFGEKYSLCVNEGKHNSVLYDGNRINMTVRPDSDLKKCEKAINEWYRTLLKVEVEKYITKWEKITGLYCNNWQIKNMKTRWGTCNITARKIWINLQLAKMPTECLEYVILHELTHLAVSNHGPQFQALLDKYMPEWREIKRKLNEEYGYMQ